MTDSGDKHVDELTLLRLSDGELADARASAARQHLIACAPCRASYEALQAETGLIRAAVSEADEALPEHIRPRQQDFSWLVVVTLALGTLGISTIWSVVIAPAFSALARMGVDGAGLGAAVVRGVWSWTGWSSVLGTLTEGVGLLLAAAGLGYGVQWLWRRVGTPTASSVLLALALVSALTPRTLDAAVVELDVETYTLPASETIDNDLVVAGRNVIIEGTVRGDLIVAASRVEISGEVQGDLLGVSESIVLTGIVRGNVRAGARRFEIDGAVTRNISAAAGSLRLGREASLGGSLSAVGARLTLSAPIKSDVMLAGGRAVLESAIDGSVLALGDHLELGPDAAIRGEARYFGVTEPVIDPASQLSSPIVFERLEDDDDPDIAGRVSSFFYFWAAAFVFGAAILLLAPEPVEVIVTSHIPSYERSILTGLVATVALLVVSIALTLTMVGIPLGVLALTTLGFGLYVAQTFVSAYLGRQILGTPSTASEGLLRLALGLFLVYAAKALPVVSFVVTLVVAAWGFGALTSYARQRLAGVSESPSPGEAV